MELFRKCLAVMTRGFCSGSVPAGPLGLKSSGVTRLGSVVDEGPNQP